MELPADKEKAEEMVRKFYALPPFDGFNPCRGDYIFAKQIRDTFGMEVDILAKRVGIAIPQDMR